MLKIVTKDFEMEQVQTSPFFDLSLLATINKGKSNERTEMKLDSYGLTFEDCIKRIVSYRMSECGTYTLREYVEKYKQITKELSLEINK